MKMKLTMFAIAVLTVTLGLLLFVFNEDDVPSHTEEAVQSYQLHNGLKVLVVENHRAPVVVSQVWYKVGSSYEHDGITGLSHVLEHMMFKGTPDHPAGEFSEIIAANGGRENAFTGQDYTAYFQRIANDRLELCLQLEADRMRNLLLDEDEFLKDESVVFAVAVDRMGYLPTHNTRYQQPITGDQQKDLIGNRTKRIFNDEVGLAAAENTEPLLKQVYHRDTGVTMWDVSAPIRVKGKHWGGFRIGFSLDKITEAQQNLQNKLIGIMGVILLVSLFVVFIAVNSALKPLTHFTKVAADLADGKVEEKIEVKGRDEIAQLADVLERLRVSLKVAMDRLRKKS